METRGGLSVEVMPPPRSVGKEVGSLENILGTGKLPLAGQSKEHLRGSQMGSVSRAERMSRDV